MVWYWVIDLSAITNIGNTIISVILLQVYHLNV